MTNPKDPQAELEDKVKDELVEYFYWDGGGNERTIDEATDKLLALFQAHQQQLLTELLGELPEKEYYGNGTAAIGTQFAGFNAAIDQVVELLNRKIGELNG